jgi:hypothetical protein
MTALLTLWCLGCSGFEPLLDAALRASAPVMTCGSGVAPMSAEMSQVSSEGSGKQRTASLARAEDRGFDCGCVSCHAAAPSVWAFHPEPQMRPVMQPGRILMPVSIVRAPLLPPPQLAA